MKHAIATCALMLSACGASSGDGNYPDAAPGSCDMQLSFSPSQPEVGTALVITGSINGSGASGPEQFSWQVSLDTQAVPHTVRNSSGSEIELTPTQAGSYRVVLNGSRASVSCSDVVQVIAVSAANAQTVTYRMRLVPQDQSAPIQEKIVMVKGGGSDWPLGSLSLEQGLDASGAISGTTTATLPAYVRATRVGGDGFPDAETFSDASGQFPLRLMPGNYDVLIVPQQNLEPSVLLAGLSPSQISNGLTVPAGVGVSGTVLDASGAALVGASVSMRQGDVPSTMAASDGSGAFTVQLHVGPSTAVSVSPPSAAASSGVPTLELASGAYYANAAIPVTVRYAAISTRVISATATASDGATPAPNARVTFIARPIPNAGTITPEGSAALAASGRMRTSVVADGAGQFSTTLPEAIYDVVVVPGPGAPAGEVPNLITLDLTGANPSPSQVSLAVAATVTGIVSDRALVPIEGVQVTAVPRGLLSNLAATVSTFSGADGTYSLGLVGSGEYDLTFRSPQQSYGLTGLSVTAPGAGSSADAGAVAMSPALAVTGTLTLPGSGAAAGVTVILLCYECSGMAAQTPVAVAVTSSTGVFSLAVPDPGVEAAP